ncbi:YchJ family protein [Microbacterium paulum]
MRSRYTAFALGDAVHLRATWHPTTAPAHLALDPARRWDGLEVLRTSGGRPGDRVGTVEFRARWYQASTRVRGELRENSRFRRVAGCSTTSTATCADLVAPAGGRSSVSTCRHAPTPQQPPTAGSPRRC